MPRESLRCTIPSSTQLAPSICRVRQQYLPIPCLLSSHDIRGLPSSADRTALDNSSASISVLLWSWQNARPRVATTRGEGITHVNVNNKSASHVNPSLVLLGDGGLLMRAFRRCIKYAAFRKKKNSTYVRYIKVSPCVRSYSTIPICFTKLDFPYSYENFYTRFRLGVDCSRGCHMYDYQKNCCEYLTLFCAACTV